MKNSPHLIMSIQKQYEKIYGQSQLTNKNFESLHSVLNAYKDNRRLSLKKLDESPLWFHDSKMVGVTLYVDLFSGDLKKLQSRVDYFVELGITYIHLMPLLKTRDGNNDGGYAVSDYKEVNPKLGTLMDLENLIQIYQEKDIAIAIDFVINHTAKEHRWAEAALKGDPYYQDYYIMYDDDTIPNEFNKTVPEVLPDIYPGNFTYYPEIKKYVFKSFSEFQWDLNFANPKVFEEIIDIFLFMANMGVRMIRLDAIPFIWKEIGTTCRNLPMVHEFMKLFQLIKNYVAPGVAILGEAIVEPHEIYKYFGDQYGKECDVLYNATLMVNVWEALATRDGRMIAIESKRFPMPKQNAWINYLRCHDDIGWGFNEEFIRQTGRDPFLHKQYLIQFYNGTFPNSFARGQNYQENKKTLDARTNGTLAALIGFEQALTLGHQVMIERAFARYELIHRIIYALPGMPLIYSGDEWLQLNDYEHALDPTKTDGRWLHRPLFSWKKVENRLLDPHSTQAFELIKSLNRLRQQDKRFSSASDMSVLDVNNHTIFAFVRDHENPLYCVFNFSEFPQTVMILNWKDGTQKFTDILTKKEKIVFDRYLHLEPYEALYLE
jgi:amylosucrase